MTINSNVLIGKTGSVFTFKTSLTITLLISSQFNKTKV